MSKAWNATEKYKVHVGLDEAEFDGPIEADDVRRLAREAGYKKFKVLDADTNEPLGADDFPFSGNILIQRVNQAA